MKIGEYDIYPIETGTFKLDGGSMFGIIPKVLWEKTNKADELNRIKLAARCLLIIGNGKVILVDDGNGNKVTKKFIEIYDLDTTNNLYSSLKKFDITPGDITDVVLSHLHFDHAGGSTIIENGVLKPAFPNAMYHVQRSQWENALNPTERDRASYIQQDFLPIKEYGRLNLIEGEIDLFSQISIIVSNGHTPGLQLLKISDSEQTLFYAADLMPCTSHIPLPYIMGFDLNPLITLADKKRILKQAAEGNWIIFFEHDPDIIAGKVKMTEKGYTFDSPIESF